MQHEIPVLLFLGFNTLKDLRTRTIPAGGTAIAAAAGLAYCIRQGRPLPAVLSALLPGAILLLFGLITGGAGSGDGIAVMVCGLFLEAAEAWQLLIGGFLCSFPVSLVLLGRTYDRHRELPFIPCLLAGYVIGLAFNAVT